MKLNVLKTINLLALISLLSVSCVDDFPYRLEDFPEGDGMLSASVTFTPITVSNLGDTRTSGTAIQNIESLCVLVYDKEKDLLKKYSQSELMNYKSVTYNDKDACKVEDDNTDEKTTAHATFSIPDLPYGQYYIFAVANMGDLSDPKYADAIQTVNGLQHIQLTWDPEHIENNNQMFGYFTPDNDMESGGFIYDKPLSFTGKASDSKIHAWLKRAASKVTVAFDPSGLNQGVTIYVRSVTVRDIPKTCLLGAENTPTSTEMLYNHLDRYDNPDYTKPTDVVANSRLEYDSKGVITTGEETGSNETDGLRLDNSIRNAVPENAHAVDAASLFFYENNQNAWLEQQPDFIGGDGKKNDRYNKQPQRTGKDEVGTTIHDPNDDKDFKDRVPLGTYVEVEAYYISSNPANPGKGTIKYRFMLGKDTSFDYDAQRNYHYKLTLGFKGWANDPDWHIDYVVTTPAIEVQPVFRVSYLYLQKSELPIKIVGNVKWFTATITENNWAPYDPYTPEDPNDPNKTSSQIITLEGKQYQVPKQTVPSDPEKYQFEWNEDAFKNPAYLNPAVGNPYHNSYLPVGQQRPEFGFLALRLPSRETTVISRSFGETANHELIDYWKDHMEGVRRFNKDDFELPPGTTNGITRDHSWGNLNKQEGEGSKFVLNDDDKYRVDPVLNDNGVAIPNQRILQLPVFTRTKTLINTSGFSGNNPYDAFERKATLHLVAEFDEKDPEGNNIRINTDVEIYQVKRITNPKGVWRADDRSDAFNVTLLEAINSNAESNFRAFTSQGEWTAFIDEDTNKDAGFSISPNGQTNGYIENGVIHGNTGSEIHFAINFNQKVDANETKCAVVKVLYHGNQCMHKIFVRKGYNAPVRMGSKEYTTSKGAKVRGRLWSSFSLYQATKTGGTEGVNETYDAVLTKNPLMLGSMFRRGRVDQGIFVWNNMQSALAALTPPGNNLFVLGLKQIDAPPIDPDNKDEIKWKDQWQEKDWNSIGYRDDRLQGVGPQYGNQDNSNFVLGNRSYNLGKYITDDRDYTYRVPTFYEFKDLTDNAEFGFGVFYGSAATAPQTEAEKAYGLIDPLNLGLFDDPNGMRAVVAYDKSSGNQVVFPMGRYGIGVRRMYNRVQQYSDFWGILHYSDVYAPLTFGPVGSNTHNNLYRPIPYNLSPVSGNIYWIDTYVPSGGNPDLGTGTGTTDSCLGWDMNYFNFDFNPYTANNWADACQIKFVIDE